MEIYLIPTISETCGDAFLISWQACSAETVPDGQFSVSVISPSGKPVEAPQVYLVTKEGIFQEGAPSKHGLFIFKMPAKLAFLFAAAPDIILL